MCSIGRTIKFPGIHEVLSENITAALNSAKLSCEMISRGETVRLLVTIRVSRHFRISALGSPGDLLVTSG